MFSRLPHARAAYSDAQCYAKMVERGVQPLKSWGSATAAEQKAWTASNCDARLCQHFFNSFGVVPYQTWGSLPTSLQQTYEDLKCNDRYIYTSE